MTRIPPGLAGCNIHSCPVRLDSRVHRWKVRNLCHCRGSTKLTNMDFVTTYVWALQRLVVP